jgi:hypothetical protein
MSRKDFGHSITLTATTYFIEAGMFRVQLGYFERAGLSSRYPFRKILSKLLRIKMENYHIIMTMGMYRIEPPWVSICLIQTY